MTGSKTGSMTGIVTGITRRSFGTMVAAAALAAPATLRAQGRARLVVIGGGFGGASAARFARIQYPQLDVTLVEPKDKFITCPYGNLILAGRRTLPQITHSYAGLVKRGVRHVRDTVLAIDPAAKTLRLAGGQTLGYDKLILSPGIAIRWGGIAGYDEAAAQIFPHAWLGADGAQVTLLRRQLEAMPDGGVVGLAIPANPFRCPPGPYERISMVASYLKKAKPKSKILALDAKDVFSKQGLFQDGWKELYGDMVEWVPLGKDGKVTRVDVKAKVFETEFGNKHKVDVGNVIPPQSAAKIAIDAGLTNEFGLGARQHAHVRGTEGAPHPRHRRRQSGDADAQVGLHRQLHLQAGGRGGRRRARRQARCGRPDLLQHLLQPRRRRLRHIRDQHLPPDGHGLPGHPRRRIPARAAGRAARAAPAGSPARRRLVRQHHAGRVLVG